MISNFLELTSTLIIHIIPDLLKYHLRYVNGLHVLPTVLQYLTHSPLQLNAALVQTSPNHLIRPQMHM